MQRFALMKPVLSTLVYFGLGVVTAAADAAVLATSEDVAGCRYVGGVLGGSAAEVLEKARRYKATHVVYTEKKVDSLIRRDAVIGEGAAYRCDVRPVVQDRGRHESGRLARRGMGSGFVINRKGYVVTNEHVVDECVEVRVADGHRATVVGRDRVNDLAVLKSNLKTGVIAIFRGGKSVQTGQDILVAGFPLRPYVGSNLHVTRGSISTLTGLRDDSGRIQISAPIQPGNSGGPVLDFSGHVVGVVVSRLNATWLIARLGQLPQNINFAIRARIVHAFLEANDVSFESAPSTTRLVSEDIAAMAKKFTVPVECWG